MAKLILIVAVARNNAIGKNNDLLWHISADLKRFKELTSGNTVLMGRKTYESLPKRPLPNRKHLILTKQEDYSIPEGGMRLENIEDLLLYSKEHPNEEIYVIGGGQIYLQCEKYCQEAYITFVDEEFEADIFFPELDENKWFLESRSERQTDEKNGLSYEFLHYIRK